MPGEAPVLGQAPAFEGISMRILLLEDNRDIGGALVDALRLGRYDVSWAKGRDEALGAIVDGGFDLAVLDVMLPGDDDGGFDVATALRTSGFDGPVLFISARDTEDDAVKGLDLGGDDYLVKPFGLREFMARVRALLRRRAQTKQAVFERAALRVDIGARRVEWNGESVEVSEREFAMLELFAHYPDRVFSTDELLDRFFPDASSGASVVRVYIRQLRHKIADGIIQTVAGGYRLGPA